MSLPHSTNFVAISACGNDSLCIRAVAEDLNKNGFVDFKDFAVIANKWLMSCSAPDWCSGCDLDKNGIVDENDLQRVAQRWLWE